MCKIGENVGEYVKSLENFRVDIILRSWGLHEISKLQGLREIPGYTHSCNIYTVKHLSLICTNLYAI